MKRTLALCLLAACSSSTSALIVSPSSVTYTLSSTPERNLKISEPGYTGPLRISIRPIGTVAGLRFPDGPQENDLLAHGPGPVTVQIVAFAQGRVTVEVSDDRGNVRRVPVNEPVDTSMLECLQGSSTEPWLIAVVVAIAGAALVFVFLLKRLQRRSARAIVVVACVAIVLVCAAGLGAAHLHIWWCRGLQQHGLGGWP